MMRRLAVATLVFSVVLLGLPLMGGSQGATADQYYQFGNKLYVAKDYTNAAKYYQAAVQMNPNNAQAFQVLGNCYLLTNRKAEAVAAYEKALALNPNNPQLAAYTQNLRNSLGGTTPAVAQASPAAAATPEVTPATANQGLQYLAQGGQLFQQKQYAAAIPYFQQASQLMPTDYRAFYYLAYAQYMNHDFKNAAVNFYLANQKQPNAALKAYADRIKASLTPADQQWVDAQVAGTATVGATATTVSKKKAKKFGARALFAAATVKLKDFNDDADFQEANAQRYGYGLVGQVPKGNIWIGTEPFFQPVPSFEVALGLGIFPVGKYTYTATGSTAITNGVPGYGVPPSTTYAGNESDTVSNEMKISTSQISLTARYYVGKDKAKAFLGAGVGFYPVSVDWTRTITSGVGNPDVDSRYTGSFTKTGIGEHVMLGGCFQIGNCVSFDPYLMYRIAKFSDLTGSMGSESGTLSTITSKDGTQHWIGVNPDVSKGETAKSLEVDLSGVQFGLGLSFHF